jgi:hypothetical protein
VTLPLFLLLELILFVVFYLSSAIVLVYSSHQNSSVKKVQFFIRWDGVTIKHCQLEATTSSCKPLKAKGKGRNVRSASSFEAHRAVVVLIIALLGAAKTREERRKLR